MAPVGLVECNAGVRSLMIEYEQRNLTLPALLDVIKTADAAIGNVAVRGGARARVSRKWQLPRSLPCAWAADAHAA